MDSYDKHIYHISYEHDKDVINKTKNEVIILTQIIIQQSDGFLMCVKPNGIMRNFKY